MSIGAGILLIVIGAILTFALNFQVDWIDLNLVGYILMAAGIIIVIIGLILLARRRSTVVETRNSVDPAPGQQVRTERREPEDRI